MKNRLISVTALSAICFGVITVGQPSASAAVPASGSFNSQVGDYIGQGKPVTVNDFTVRKYATNGVQIWSPGTGWNIIIDPKAQKLAVGTYQTVRMATDSSVGMDIGGAGRGCNKSTGTLWVDDLEIGADGDPSRIAIRVEQHCEGVAAAFFGSVVSAGATTAPVQPPAALPTPPPIPSLPTVQSGPDSSPKNPTPPAAAQNTSFPTDALPADKTPKPGFPAGTCAYLKKLQSGSTLVRESCQKPHQYEVVGSFQNAFNGPYTDVERRNEICAQVFRPYVGTAIYETTYRPMMYFPSVATWKLGNRSLVCLVGVNEGRLKPGSVKGTRL
jgi:hypothetical protein